MGEGDVARAAGRGVTKGTQDVRLSARDWIGIAGVVLTLVIAAAGAYLRHDRMMVNLMQQQADMLRRLAAVESVAGVDRVRIDDRVRNIELTRFSSADAIALENRWTARLDQIDKHLSRIEAALMGDFRP